MLLIVIVNFKTAELTIEALRSLASEIASLSPVQVAVIENGSNDQSAQKIAAAIAENGWMWCRLQAVEKNLGFAAGNNLPIREALALATPPDFVLLLNPDTIVRPGAIQTLMAFLTSHPAAGIAGSRLEDPDSTPQRSSFRFPSILTELNDTLRMAFLERGCPECILAPAVRADAHATDWVAGASMLIRREVFEKIGLLDEGYFVYFEEVDLCLRARRAGFGVWYVPESHVVHLVGQASQVNTREVTLKRRPRYWFDARRRYYLKNHGWLYTQFTNLAFAGGLIVFRIRRLVIRGPIPDPPYFLLDFIRYSFI